MYRRNVAVIGMSTSLNLETARVFSDSYKLHFLEMDKYLEHYFTYSVDEILKTMGIEYFIKCEAKAYNEIGKHYDNTIIGATNTALINNENIMNLKKSCYIVYLAGDDNLIRRRFMRDRLNLLKDYILDNYNDICCKIDKEIIPNCDIVIDTLNKTPLMISKKISIEMMKIIANMETVT